MDDVHLNTYLDRCSGKYNGEQGGLRPLRRALLFALLLAGVLFGLDARPAHAQETPALDARLLKTVGANPGVCAPEGQTSIDAAPGSVVYICYTLTNTGSVGLEPLDLIDNYDNPAAFEPVVWQRTPGQVLAPGARLEPTGANGLIRAVTVSAAAGSSLTGSAGWGVVAADGSQTRQITSNPVTINVVSLSTQATLTGYTSAGTATVNCSSPSVTLTSYQSPVYLCLTLTNASSITLTQHQVSIPGFDVDFVLDKPLGPSGTVSATLRITNVDNAKMAPRLNAPTVTSRAYITSTNATGGTPATLSVSTSSEPIVVNGPAASVSLLKTINSDATSCSTTTTLSNVSYGLTFYYCLVLINSASLTFTDHIFTEPALSIAGSFNEVLPPGRRISITNNYLQVNKGITPFLGPFTVTQSINNTMLYTASNPGLDIRASASAAASISMLTPTPTNTGAPTPTNTPVGFETPIPTPTITPIPPTPTPTWTWTPSPTPTPPPTVLIFSTPGGQAPTPYPQIAGLQTSAQNIPAPNNQFVSPLAPGAVATQPFAFPTPVLDPFGATATAQAQFAFPTPVLDPFGATATAQAQVSPLAPPQAQLSPLAPPLLDPFAATATALAAPALPTPLLDPFAATAQASLNLPAPVVDAFSATAIAQAATLSASLDSGQAAMTPTLGTETALLPPGAYITVTATFTPEPPTPFTQRPVEPPTPPPSLDTRTFFVRVLDSAGSTVALLWFLGGSVLFFVTAGVLAGLSFRAREQARFALEPGDNSDIFIAQPGVGEPGVGEPAVGEPAGGQSAAGPAQQSAANSKAGDNWPSSLP